MLGGFNIPKYASYLTNLQTDVKIYSLSSLLSVLNLKQYNYVFNRDTKL